MPYIEISLESLTSGTPLRVENGRAGIVVIRGEDSLVNAFEDVCPHAQWRLSDGEVNAGVLECPGHAWEFNTRTGRCLNVPAYALRQYQVTVAGGLVRIDWAGAAERVQVETTVAQPVCGSVES